MKLFSLAILFALTVPAAAHSSPPSPVILANNNRLAAGQFTGRELRLSLEARWGKWYPDGPTGSAAPIQAFAESGRAPEVPGPMIRVPAGTLVTVTMRNSIPGSRLSLHGFMDRPALRDRPFDLSFAQTRTVRFHADTPGTYYYWGSTTGNPVNARTGADSQLSGAFIVDPPNTSPQKTRDRVFVIGQWVPLHKAKGGLNRDYEVDVINGRSWPYTERFSYNQGESVRWRWINTTLDPHPLHLHGFYFMVDSRGDGIADTAYARDANRDRRVTELVSPGRTFAMSWVAARTGNWLFHCHLTYHAARHLPIADMVAGKPKMDAAQYENTYLPHAAMGGLIVGITVHGRSAQIAAQPRPKVRLGLRIEPATDDQPAAPSFRYVLDVAGTSITEPGAVGPAIVLTRGVPVAIEVTNHLKDPTSVHWHGIELTDSYYDGGVGFSGAGRRLAPMIDPGQTFEVQMIPPRAGTFIYHTHMGDVWQLRGGLAGPLIVLEPGKRFDVATDHIYTITTTHAIADAGKIFVNGTFQPPTLTVRAGVLQRIRFINMTTFWTNATVSLSTGGHTVQWNLLAVDGADLPAARRGPQSAVDTVTIGETRDYTFTPVRGEMRLQIWPAPNYGVVTIPVHVI